MTITLGMACGEFIKTQTVGTLIKLFKKYPTMDLSIRQSPYIFDNRENVVLDTLKNDSEYLFFVDTDMVFEPEILEKLILHNKDIVGAMYNRRKIAPNNTIVGLKEETPKELFKNDIIATGCTLIKAKIFYKIPRPWFSIGSEEQPKGEDVYFSEKARKSGYELWIDPTLKVGHIGEYVY